MFRYLSNAFLKHEHQIIKNKLKTMRTIWSTLLAGAVGGAVTFGAIKFTESPQANSVSPNQQSSARQVNYGGGPVPFDFTKAADKSMPAVVHIKASESQEAAFERQKNQRNTNPFEYFFGQSFGYEPQPRSGTGSGHGLQRDPTMTSVKAS